MANEELKVGTKLQKHEGSLYLYGIQRIIRDEAAGQTLYRVALLSEGPRATGTWVDKETLHKYWPFIVGEPAVAVPDPVGGDDPGVAGKPADAYTLSIVEELRSLGWTVEPPKAPKPPMILHKWSGEYCPQCRSTDIDHWVNDSPDHDSGSFCVRAMCRECQEEWAEIYVRLGADGGEDFGTQIALTYEGEVLQNIGQVLVKLSDLLPLLAQLPIRDVEQRISGIIALIPEHP